MLTFVDTNVFLRLAVVADENKQMIQAKRLFEQAQTGNVTLVTGPPVLFEVAWVLSRLYKRTNNEIMDFLEAIISYPNLRVLDKEYVIAAIDTARSTNNAFADCYIAISAKNTKTDNVATFNRKHFSKLGVEFYPFEN